MNRDMSIFTDIRRNIRDFVQDINELLSPPRNSAIYLAIN
jgi:hypothetical protein